MSVAIKTNIKQMPEYCDDCRWFGTRPHPYKGWSDLCELMNQCMDDDQPKEWIYDGNGRPQACPLIEVAEQTEPIPRDDHVETGNDHLEARCLNCHNAKACKENQWEGCVYEPTERGESDEAD